MMPAESLPHWSSWSFRANHQIRFGIVDDAAGLAGEFGAEKGDAVSWPMNMPCGCGVVAAEKEEIANLAVVRRLACFAIKLVPAGLIENARDPHE
jgi:hypothetical protein